MGGKPPSERLVAFCLYLGNVPPVHGDAAGQTLVSAIAASKSLKMFVLRAEYLAIDTVLALADALALDCSGGGSSEPSLVP